MKEILPEKQPPHRVDEHHVHAICGAMKISAEPAFIRKVRDMIIDRKITSEHKFGFESHSTGWEGSMFGNPSSIVSLNLFLRKQTGATE